MKSKVTSRGTANIVEFRTIIPHIIRKVKQTPEAGSLSLQPRCVGEHFGVVHQSTYNSASVHGGGGNRTCPGDNWTKIADVNPGQDYTFTLTAEDPGVRLEAEVHIITGASPSIQHLVKSVNRAGYQCADIVFAPLASAEATLSRDEKVLAPDRMLEAAMRFLGPRRMGRAIRCQRLFFSK